MDCRVKPGNDGWVAGDDRRPCRRRKWRGGADAWVCPAKMARRARRIGVPGEKGHGPEPQPHHGKLHNRPTHKATATKYLNLNSGLDSHEMHGHREKGKPCAAAGLGLPTQPRHGKLHNPPHPQDHGHQILKPECRFRFLWNARAPRKGEIWRGSRSAAVSRP